jgi:hypothetical protein
LKRLKNAAEMAVSMAEIAVVQAAEEKKKKTTERQDMLKLVPDAVVKFKAKDRDVCKLTKNEIAALLMGYYGIDVVSSLKKEKKLYFTNKLKDEIESDGTKIPPTAASATVAMAVDNSLVEE